MAIIRKQAEEGFYGNNKNYIIAFLLILNIIAVGWIVVTRVSSINKLGKFDRYNLISEDVAWLNAEEFSKKQDELKLAYTDLKTQVTDFFNKSNLNGRYAFYFQDLETGSWIGIDEKTALLPASLIKIPTMVAVLKKVEDGELSLNQRVMLTPYVLDDNSGWLYTKGVGAEITIKVLLEEMIERSDNTAFWALDNLLTDDEYNNARLGLGLPRWRTGEIVLFSPREISRTFKSLYLSTYLNREFSQLALAMLSGTDYDTWLVSGAPAGVTIAHKHGSYVDGGYFHDCGIVYAPKTPYVICIMSHDSTKEEADKVIPEISRITYEYAVKDTSWWSR